MEIDLSLFAQRVAMLALLAGLVGGCLFVLLHGAVVALSDRLRSRANTAQRIAQARIRQQSILGCAGGGGAPGDRFARAAQRYAYPSLMVLFIASGLYVGIHLAIK